MSLDLERSLRTEFAADAERAPVATDLAAAARRRVRARRRRLAAAAAGLAAASLLSASTLLLDGPGTTDQAVNPSPGPSLTPGTSGPVAIQQADWIDGARDISIEVKATSFDSACATALSATVQESAGEIRISVRASSRAGTACPPELRRILVSLDSVGNGRPLVDELTGKRIPPGEPPPNGHHPGDPPLPFNQVILLDGGRSLELRFSGVPSDSGRCGARYVGTVRETSQRVEVRVDTVPTGTPGGPCYDIAGPRTATVHLSQPLGDRELYDASGRQLHPVDG
ncbi:hypothetical protein GCM10022251_36090 [Phytohabitans flavus]|uniref:Uncharacterized protein n=1 Tax=Phytohabitans flavus TaxID=1076124 RepID=A0A6F8XWA5_9ACTN|nr:hypothetical protein [Phytohabitans flavus]BCB78093.1 hypothetical protein Pflav_045030 [Phytohabitans flavus]